MAALRFEVLGMRGGRPVCVLEHVTRLRPDLAPDWPQPAGQGCYRVEITGEPNYTLDLQLMGTDGDHNTGRAQGHGDAPGQRGRGRGRGAARARHRARPAADHRAGARRAEHRPPADLLDPQQLERVEPASTSASATRLASAGTCGPTGSRTSTTAAAPTAASTRPAGTSPSG